MLVHNWQFSSTSCHKKSTPFSVGQCMRNNNTILHNSIQSLATISTLLIVAFQKIRAFRFFKARFLSFHFRNKRAYIHHPGWNFYISLFQMLHAPLWNSNEWHLIGRVLRLERSIQWLSPDHQKCFFIDDFQSNPVNIAISTGMVNLRSLLHGVWK